jgi:hypothetical protein
MASVDGTIDLGLAPFLRRTLKKAADDGAAAVVLELNTLGGRLDAAVLIRDELLKTPLSHGERAETRTSMSSFDAASGCYRASADCGRVGWICERGGWSSLRVHKPLSSPQLLIGCAGRWTRRLPCGRSRSPRVATCRPDNRAGDAEVVSEPSAPIAERDDGRPELLWPCRQSGRHLPDCPDVSAGDDTAIRQSPHLRATHERPSYAPPPADPPLGPCSC